ncbi:MAG: aminotransferase class V-fold PLP-dependent enzyme [Eubacteriales bacterium]
MSIYFDNAATTRPYDFTRLFRNYIDSGWYNPSSIYKPSVDAAEAMNNSRLSIARALNAFAGNIVFTSGGTEANNTAIFACAEGRRRHFITTEVEHSSGYEAFLRLKNKGMNVDFIRPERRLYDRFKGCLKCFKRGYCTCQYYACQ